MNKIEIIKIIQANRQINKNKEILSIITDKRLDRVKDKYYWFPKIEELQKEFDILSHEIESAIKENNQNENYIKKCNCDHSVRLEYYGLFSDTYKCVFCGESISSDNCVNWEYSINRNKYCASLVAKYQEDEDYGYIKDGYTKEQIYEIIMNILKDKNDDEEIDLVQEFKSLNLLNSKINEDKKVNENYILIINGSNKHYIDNESYLYKNGTKLGLDFIKYFSGILNTKVELIDNNEVLLSEEFKEYFPSNNYNLKFTKYDTISELESILKNQKDISFKLIIDLSELYKYSVENSVITKENYKLNISDYFPNSKIIKIGNLSKKSLEELSVYLHSFDNHYAYQNETYYCLEDNDIKSMDLESTCNKLKKLLKKEV